MSDALKKLWKRNTTFTNSSEWLIGQVVGEVVTDVAVAPAINLFFEGFDAAASTIKSRRDAKKEREAYARLMAYAEPETKKLIEQCQKIKDRIDEWPDPETFVEWILSAVDESPEIIFTAPLLKPFAKLVEALYPPNQFNIPEPPADKRPIPQAIYRDKLHKYIHSYDDTDALFAKVVDFVLSIIYVIIFALPENLTTEKFEPIRLPSPYKAYLPDLLNAAEIIADIPSYLTHRAPGLLAYEECLETIKMNFCRASGISYNPHTFDVNKLTFPKDYKKPDLVDAYLYGTPFHSFFDASVHFDIPDNVRPEHMLVVASTGTGKSQFIQADIHHQLKKEQRPGIVVIDSQGQMLPKLERLNLWRDDLIVIDPEDISPPALNMFALPERIKNYDRNTREIIESTTIQLFGFLFAALDQTLTGRQSTFFSFVTRLVLSIPDATIRTLREVLEEEPKSLSTKFMKDYKVA